MDNPALKFTCSVPGVRLPRTLARLQRAAPPVAQPMALATIPPIEMEVLPAETLPTFTDSLELFREECERRFAGIHKRLTFHIHGENDLQQWEAAVRVVYEVGVTRRNVQIIAPTGQGKTFVCGAALRMLGELFPDRFDVMTCLAAGRQPPIIIQPAKALVQTRNILLSFGISHAIITTLASLRASLGEALLEWKTVVVNQLPVVYPFWKMERAPSIIWMDESQQLKNESTQTDIIESAAMSGIPVIPASATPYSRPCQAKAIAIILGPELSRGIVLTPKVWPSFVKDCCPAKTRPEDWSPVALRRVQEFLEPQTVRWAIDYPHKVITKLVACDFINEESRARYDAALADWNEVRVRRGKDPLVGMAEVLVAIAKFNQVAEEERVDPLVRYAVDFWLEQKAKRKPASIILGFAFRTSADRASARLRAILGERDYKKLVAHVVGGVDASADVAAFQADAKPFMILTVSCGGAALSLDHNSSNRNQRFMFCSAVWNDIQMVQLAGRTQRLCTQSASYLYIMYFRGTAEARKIAKVRRKVSTLREITTKIRARTVSADGAEGDGTFVGDIEDVEHVSGGMLAPGAIPTSEDEEETLAEQIVGTTTKVEFEHEDEPPV